jgi:hypothetical protein
MRLIVLSSIDTDMAKLEKLIEETRRIPQEDDFYLKRGLESLEYAKQLTVQGAGKAAVREKLDEAIRCVAHPWFARKDGHHILELFGRRALLNEMFWGWAPCHCWGMRGLCARNMTIRKICWKLGLFPWL